MTNKQIAILEALLASGMLVNMVRSDSQLDRSISAVTCLYLAYGSYLNLQNRVKLLPKNDARTKTNRFILEKK